MKTGPGSRQRSHRGFGSQGAMADCERLSAETRLDPMLMVIGLNHRTAPVEVRERFWISESRRFEALSQLRSAEGVDEIIVLATCKRTEFLLWASEPTLAENSVLRFLTAQYGLKLCEWKRFYRLIDEAALLHIFRVGSGLDSMVPGEPQIVSQLNNAWQQAEKFGSTGRYLGAVVQKALTVSKRVRNETAIKKSARSVPYAAVELARRILETLENKRVLLLGAGKMGELSARCLARHGATSVCVINRTYKHAQELATALGGTAARFEDRLQNMANADVVISSTSCPHVILSREEAEWIVGQRDCRPLLLVDIALPRDIDPRVRELEGVLLYDLDDLEKLVEHNAGERETAAVDAQQIVEEEALGFRHTLLAERVVPTLVALRIGLHDICRQELESFKREYGPFSKDQDALAGEVAARITRKIAGSLAQGIPGKGGAGANDSCAAAALAARTVRPGGCRRHSLKSGSLVSRPHSTYTPLRRTAMIDDTGIGGARQQFPSTRWSLIEGTRSAHAEERQRALDTLISAYWKPVYKYIRLHWNKDSEPAKDLTQDFFVGLVEKHLLDRFEPERARLRTYLRVCVDGLVMNQNKAALSVKRGGDTPVLPLDFESAEGELAHLQVAGPGNPEELFSREFARSLFGLSLERLRSECQDKGKALHFQLLELYDVDDGGKELTYDEVAQRFGIKPTDVTNYLAYARKQFRRIVLEQLRRMTATEDEFRREAQTLLGVKL